MRLKPKARNKYTKDELRLQNANIFSNHTSYDQQVLEVLILAFFQENYQNRNQGNAHLEFWIVVGMVLSFDPKTYFSKVVIDGCIEFKFPWIKPRL